MTANDRVQRRPTMSKEPMANCWWAKDIKGQTRMSKETIMVIKEQCSTRKMVLQSSDCCWHYDYCVVSSCMFLGLNFKWKMIALQCLHNNLHGYRGSGTFPTGGTETMSFSYIQGLWYSFYSFDFVSFSGSCHYRIQRAKWLLASGKHQWVENSSIMVYTCM